MIVNYDPKARLNYDRSFIVLANGITIINYT
jgi:hypothetical protein